MGCFTKYFDSKHEGVVVYPATTGSLAWVLREAELHQLIGSSARQLVSSSETAESTALSLFNKKAPGATNTEGRNSSPTNTRMNMKQR